VGAYVVFGFWQASLLIQSYDLPEVWAQRVPYIRDLLLGLAIIVVLLLMPRGLIPEERRVSIWVERAVRRAAPVRRPAPEVSGDG
jgi:ABC-type branched-subunit amino acid transport system permease subunit